MRRHKLNLFPAGMYGRCMRSTRHIHVRVCVNPGASSPMRPASSALRPFDPNTLLLEDEEEEEEVEEGLANRGKSLFRRGRECVLQGRAE